MYNKTHLDRVKPFQIDSGSLVTHWNSISFFKINPINEIWYLISVDEIVAIYSLLSWSLPFEYLTKHITYVRLLSVQTLFVCFLSLNLFLKWHSKAFWAKSSLKTRRKKKKIKESCKYFLGLLMLLVWMVYVTSTMILWWCTLHMTWSCNT